MSGVLIELSRDEARWLAVTASGLDRRPFRRRVTAQDILATIQRLGSVQLDTISVISRSHETVLWSRLGPYDLALWQDLYAGEQRITEYWAHAAAIIPREDLRHFRTHMERRGEQEWYRHPENLATIERVLARIRAEGPLGSRHFETPEGASRAGAWEWYGAKPEREVLSSLWTAGQLVLSRRDRGFGRTWDVPERAIPELWRGEAMADDERDRTLIARALRALGVTTARWASDYFRTGGQAYVPATKIGGVLEELEAAGACVRVVVPGIETEIWLDPDLLPCLEAFRAGRMRPTLTTLLSPFDNLIWNRHRTEQLWNFFYRLECYTPEPRRMYGYYTLPILHRGRLIGRLDPSYDRRTRFLTVKALHLEPGVRLSNSLVSAIVAAIRDLIAFLGGEPDRWRVLHANPDALLPLVRYQIAV